MTYEHRVCVKHSADVPVRSAILPMSPPNLTLFGMKSCFKDPLAHNAGCLKSSKSINASSPSTSSGLHAGSPSALDAFAKLNRQSSSASTRIARSHTLRSRSNSAYSLFLNSLIAVLRFSRASLSFRMVPCRAGTMKRLAFYIVWVSLGRCWRYMAIRAHYLGGTTQCPILRRLVSLLPLSLDEVDFLEIDSVWTVLVWKNTRGVTFVPCALCSTLR